MMRFIRPRLRKPVGIAFAGPAYAAAWLVHGGNGWLWAIVTEIGVIAFAIATYVRGGRDSDEDALAGSRPDERQQLIAQRSWALAGRIAMFAAFAGVTLGVGASAPPPVRSQGPGGSLPGPAAGHPLHCVGAHGAAARRNLSQLRGKFVSS